MKTFLFALAVGSTVVVQAQTWVRDAQFGNGGLVRTDNWPTSSADAMVVQPDGRILLGGAADQDLALVRYNADGTLDPSFDGDGLVRTSLGGYAMIADMALQNDGRIVVAGNVMIGSTPSRFLLARYNTDGSLDAGFAQGGILVIAVGPDAGAARSVAIDQQGRIVAAGWCYQPGGQPMHEEMAIVRVNNDGALDASFDGDGIRTLAAGPNCEASSVVVTDDDRILVGGTSISNNDHDPALACLLDNGTLDPAFGNAGIVVSGLPSVQETINDMVVQPDGRILLGGTIILGGTEDMLLARFDPDGSVDQSFSGGRVTAAIGAFTNEIGCSLFLQPDGRILFGGSFGLSAMMYSYLLLARFEPDGSLDATFNGGIFMNAVSGSYTIAQAIAMDTDGAVLAAGFNGLSTQFHTCLLARFVQEEANAVLENGEMQKDVRAFPNPATDQTTLILDGWSAQSTSIRVLDVAGRQVHLPDPLRTHDGTDQRLLLDLSALPCGSYVIMVEQGDRRRSVAIVKQ